jgi:hypothetical protein
VYTDGIISSAVKAVLSSFMVLLIGRVGGVEIEPWLAELQPTSNSAVNLSRLALCRRKPLRPIELGMKNASCLLTPFNIEKPLG